MKKGAIIGIIVAGILVLGTGGVVGGVFITKNIVYNKADEILYACADDYSKADYEASIRSAKNSFEFLKSYKESEEKVLECDYCLAGYFLNDKRYEEAKTIYNSLNGYKDSADKIKEAEYYEADNILSDGDYEEAKIRFTELGSFMDANEKVLECDYMKALNLENEKDYEAARSLFASLGDYSDSATQILECDYQEALDYMDEGDYETAKKMLVSLDDYSESKSKVTECDYGLSVIVFNNKDYASAKEQFEKLGDYSNSELFVKACDFYLTFDLYEEHEIDAAGEIFKDFVCDEEVMMTAFNDKRENTTNPQYLDFDTGEFVPCDKEIIYAFFDEEDNIYNYKDYPRVELYYKDGSDDFFMFSVHDPYHEVLFPYNDSPTTIIYTYDKNGKQLSNF